MTVGRRHRFLTTHRHLHKAAHSTAAGYPPEQMRRERGRGNLVLEVTYLHRCHLLSVTQNHSGTLWEGLPKDVKTRNQESLRATLEEAGYHKPWDAVCWLVWPVFRVHINGIILLFFCNFFHAICFENSFMLCITKSIFSLCYITMYKRTIL